jgi:hypothetical protein
LGEVAERLKAPHSKCGIGASLSGVRIPPSPPVTIDFIENSSVFASISIAVPMDLKECYSSYNPPAWAAKKTQPTTLMKPKAAGSQRA